MVRSTEVGRTRKAEGWRRLWENGCGWAKRTIFFFKIWGKYYRLWKLLASKTIKGPLLSLYWQRPGCKARASWLGGTGYLLAQDLELSGACQLPVLEVRAVELGSALVGTLAHCSSSTLPSTRLKDCFPPQVLLPLKPWRPLMPPSTSQTQPNIKDTPPVSLRMTESRSPTSQASPLPVHTSNPALFNYLLYPQNIHSFHCL